MREYRARDKDEMRAAFDTVDFGFARMSLKPWCKGAVASSE